MSFQIFHFSFHEPHRPDNRDHEVTDANWSGVRMAMALAGSFCFVFLLISSKVVYDVEGTKAEIPALFEDKPLIEILNPKPKHNPIDDFVLSAPEARTQSSVLISAN